MEVSIGRSSNYSHGKDYVRGQITSRMGGLLGDLWILKAASDLREGTLKLQKVPATDVNMKHLTVFCQATWEDSATDRDAPKLHKILRRSPHHG